MKVILSDKPMKVKCVGIVDGNLSVSHQDSCLMFKNYISWDSCLMFKNYLMFTVYYCHGNGYYMYS